MFLCALCLCTVVHAKRADQNQPIYIQADRWTHDDLKQVSILSGQVVVTQGTTLLKGDQIVMREDPEGYYFLSSTAGHGVRAYFRRKREGVDEYIEGEGQRIDYDGKSEMATLSRQAVVRRITGSAKIIDEIHGNVIRYDGLNDLYTASGSPDAAGNPAGRVRAILVPRTTGPTSFKEGTSVPLDMANTLNHNAQP